MQTHPSAPAPQALSPLTLKRRMACWLYEGMLLFGIVWLAGYLFGTLMQTKHALMLRLELQVFIFAVLGVYFVWFWTRKPRQTAKGLSGAGQTLAMKTWHISLVDTQGHPLSWQRAALRYTASWLWLAPPLCMAWLLGIKGGGAMAMLCGWIGLYALQSRMHPKQQFLHDALCGTALVDARPAASSVPSAPTAL